MGRSAIPVAEGASSRLAWEDCDSGGLGAWARWCAEAGMHRRSPGFLLRSRKHRSALSLKPTERLPPSPPPPSPSPPSSLLTGEQALKNIAFELLPLTPTPAWLGFSNQNFPVSKVIKGAANTQEALRLQTHVEQRIQLPRLRQRGPVCPREGWGLVSDPDRAWDGCRLGAISKSALW